MADVVASEGVHGVEHEDEGESEGVREHAVAALGTGA